MGDDCTMDHNALFNSQMTRTSLPLYEYTDENVNVAKRLSFSIQKSKTSIDYVSIRNHL